MGSHLGRLNISDRGGGDSDSLRRDGERTDIGGIGDSLRETVGRPERPDLSDPARTSTRGGERERSRSLSMITGGGERDRGLSEITTRGGDLAPSLRSPVRSKTLRGGEGECLDRSDRMTTGTESRDRERPL